MEIIIIGAGASGMVAAIESAKKGHKVTVLELKEEACKKIYATGNGRCNITNHFMDISCYRSDDFDKLKDLIIKYNTNWLCDYFKEMGLYTTSIGEYIYPLTKQASTVVNILMHQCKRLNVDFIYNCNVKKIEPRNNGDDGFIIRTIINKDKLMQKEEYTCDKLIVACGGKANPKLGSDGSGYYLLSKLGHTINEPVPSLVPLVCDDGYNGRILSIMQKVRTHAVIKAYTSEFIGDSTGELQLTDYGVSGIVTFQLSGNIARRLSKSEKIHISIDFLPDYDYEKLILIIKGMLEIYNSGDIYADLHNVLSALINDRISEGLVKYIRLTYDTRGKSDIFQSTDDLIEYAVNNLKNYKLLVTGTKSFDVAQVCSGGVSFKEVTKHFESKLINNLYITGELLDVDGICGGYNLHFAFISGIIAGKSI